MKIKFITVNIWFGGKIWDNLTSYIKEERPDILAIQEVYDGKEAVLEKRFRTIEEFHREFPELPYSIFEPTAYDTGINVEWGNAIFSKFPISNPRNIFFNLPHTRYDFQIDPDPSLAAEGMVVGDIDINGKIVTVGSWHGVWDHHGFDTENRDIMVSNIIKTLSGKDNLILAGDTNMNPDTNGIQRVLKELNLVSVFGNSLKSTFNMKQKENPGNYDSSPVDMVLLSPQFKIVSKKMPEVDVSDHFPLEVELEIT